jgi:hypothetical protein
MKKVNAARAAVVVLFIFAGIAVAALGAAGTGTRSVDKTTARVVELELTFANGDVARVSQFDRVPFTIEEHGRVTSIVPIVGDAKSNGIQLEISQPGGVEMKLVGAVRLGSEPMKIDRAGLASVKLNGFSEAAAIISPGGKGCCVRDCSGRLICNSLCVCTKCGACGPCFCVPFP